MTASKSLPPGLERAASETRGAIHDDDVERLKQLLAEYPALLSWRDDRENKGGLLGFATDAYGDAGDPKREQWFTRGAAAELLIDAGAVVAPSVCDGILDSRAREDGPVAGGCGTIAEPTTRRSSGRRCATHVTLLLRGRNTRRVVCPDAF